MGQELFIGMSRDIIWNFDKETKKDGGTMLNKQGGLTHGDLSLCSILWIETYAQYIKGGSYLFKLKDLMEGLGLSSKSTNNRQLPKIRTALVELQNYGLLFSEKPMNKYRMDEWIVCQLHLRDEDVPFFKIYKDRVRKIIDTVGSKNIVKCLVVETVYRSREYQTTDNDGKTESELCVEYTPHCAEMSWRVIAPKINAVMSKHETWDKYVKIMEDKGLLFTKLKYKNDGSVKCKIYSDDARSLNLRIKQDSNYYEDIVDDSANVEENIPTIVEEGMEEQPPARITTKRGIGGHKPNRRKMEDLF